MGELKSKSKMVHIKFGVPFFDVFDPRFKDFSVPVSIRGEVNFFVKNYKKFFMRKVYKNIIENRENRLTIEIVCVILSKYEIFSLCSVSGYSVRYLV